MKKTMHRKPTRAQIEERLQNLFLKALDAAEAAADTTSRLEAMRQVRVVILLHKAYKIAMPPPAQPDPDTDGDDIYRRGYKGRPTTLDGMHALLEEKLSRLVEQHRADRIARDGPSGHALTRA